MNQDHIKEPTQRPLWAPWRIEYIRGPKDGACFLCEKGRSMALEDHVVHQGESAFVLLNDFPYNAGHLLVAPYRHVSDLAHLTAEEHTEMMDLIVRAERALRRAISPEGFNIGFNIGGAAGAGLRDHVHGHIVPRWVGDTNFMPVLADVRIVPESLNQTTELLRNHWE